MNISRISLFSFGSGCDSKSSLISLLFRLVETRMNIYSKHQSSSKYICGLAALKSAIEIKIEFHKTVIIIGTSIIVFYLQNKNSRNGELEM